MNKPVLLLLSFFVSLSLQAQFKYIKDVKALPDHPRILLLKGEEEGIRKNIAASPEWKKMHQMILDECDVIVQQPLLQREQTGRRLLAVSREAIRRIFYLSYAYRIDGQEKYMRHAEKEMLAISAFSDWNPSHFLDVAEMTLAMAIGYDWLYPALSESSRKTIKTAIFQKGLDPSMNESYAWFLKAEHNWNQVCNAGMAYGAFILFEDMPEFSKWIIERSIDSIKLPMHDYAPHGAYAEGYGYWDYGTSFNVLFLSAIEKMFGTDYGLSKSEGFLNTAYYQENMTGLSNLCFNYADCGLGGGLSPAMFWFADKLKDTSLLWNEKTYIQGDRKHNRNRLLPAVMVWGSKVRLNEIPAPKELLWMGQGTTPVVMMRTSWTDPNGIYVGFKGGIASSNHAHMDAGSFIMEANGVRWASDFGMQEYHSLESKGVDLWNRTQNSQRWQVFRYNNRAHNTLTIDDQLHNVNGKADIKSTSSNPDFLNATTDLSAVLEGQLAKSLRGIAIIDKSYVIVRDEVKTLNKETTVRWTMLTTATAKITGKNSIELKKDGKSLKLQVMEPAKVTMKTWSTVSPNDFDSPNPGTTLIGFEVKIPANTEAALSVKLIPQGAKKTMTNLPELASWPK